MSIKKIIGTLHLWFGLASGLVIFIVCLTAAIWAFSPEIEDLASYRHVIPSNAAYLPASVLKQKADAQFKGKKANRLYFYERSKAAVAEYYGDDYYYAVYLNPYTAQVLKVRDEGHTFFRYVILGHYSLWMGNVGLQIVRWSTLTFLVMLITGIVLWWPRNKAARKQRFKVKLDASPKRLNYDLHNVLGFYAAWVMLFAALTGVIWTFDFAANAEYFIASGGQKDPGYPNPVIKKVTAATPLLQGIDSVYAATLASYKTPVQSSCVAFPDSDSSAFVIETGSSTSRATTDYHYFDPYTFKAISQQSFALYKNANGGEIMKRWNYDIHIGNVIGITGRLAMFLGVLIGASLPVTGFYIWWGRRKKKSPAAKKKAHLSVPA